MNKQITKEQWIWLYDKINDKETIIEWGSDFLNCLESWFPKHDAITSVVRFLHVVEHYVEKNFGKD